MSYHKKNFLIQGHTEVREVTGWVDETNTYGFHKIEKTSGTLLYWVATDLKSGARITQGKTRKECVEWIENNKELIDKLREKEEYRQIVLSFENKKRE